MLVASLLAVAAAANKSSKRPKELVELGRRKGREPDRTGLVMLGVQWRVGQGGWVDDVAIMHSM